MIIEWLRRHQNVVVPLGLFLYSLSLLSWGAYSKRNIHLNLFSRAVISVIGFGQGLVTGAGEGTTDLVQRYLWLRSVEKENRRLQEQLQELKRENSFLEERSLENERLRRLLYFRPKERISNWIAAEVQAYGTSGFNQTITIDKGSRDGIRARMTVITYDGALVGQILDEPGSGIGLYSSQVLLITDRRSRVQVLVQRPESRARGILAGRPEGDDCELLFVERLSDIRYGDVLISFSLSGLFMKGLPVGRVVDIVNDPSMFYPRVRVEPLADLARLEEVMVILPQGEGP